MIDKKCIHKHYKKLANSLCS